MICSFISILPRFCFPATVCHRSAIALVSRFPGTTTTKLLIPTHTPSREKYQPTNWRVIKTRYLSKKIASSSVQMFFYIDAHTTPRVSAHIAFFSKISKRYPKRKERCVIRLSQLSCRLFRVLHLSGKLHQQHTKTRQAISLYTFHCGIRGINPAANSSTSSIPHLFSEQVLCSIEPISPAEKIFYYLTQRNWNMSSSLIEVDVTKQSTNRNAYPISMFSKLTRKTTLMDTQTPANRIDEIISHD